MFTSISELTGEEEEGLGGKIEILYRSLVISKRELGS